MKLKQFLALAALAVGSSAWAQGWVGETVTAGTDYYLYNVEAGYFLSAGNNWGTRATLDTPGFIVTPSASGSGYILSTSKNGTKGGINYNGKGVGANGYMDNGDKNVWTLENVGTDEAPVYTMKSGTAYLYYDGSNSATIADANANLSSDASKWLFISKDRVATQASKATMGNPVDMTYLIQDANFTPAPSNKRERIYTWPGDLAYNFDCAEKFHAAFDAYQEIDVPNGKYELSIQGFYRLDNGSTTLAYLYANDESVALKDLADEEGDRPNSMESAHNSFVAGKYNNKVEVIVTNGKLRVGVKTEATLDWVIFDNMKLTYYGPIVEEGADLTVRIANPSFELGNLTGWECSSANDTGVKQNSDNTYKISNADGSYVFNTWGGSAEKYIQQEISNLPQGQYIVTALVASDAGVKVKLYANTNYEEVSCTGKGTGVDGSVTTFVGEDGKLTIKATSNDWYKVDNFRLTYVGEDFPEYTLATGVMNASVAQAQADAETEFLNGKSVETYNALLSAIDAAKASVEMYAANSVALDAQKALMDATNVYNPEGFDAYKTAYETALAAYDNLTATEAVVNPNSATGWHASTAYNFLLTPWKLGESACNEFGNALYINTWSTEGDTDGSNFTVPFFEYWVADGQNLAANAISTTLDVENGLYEVEAQVRASHNSNDFKAVNLTVNDGDAVNVADGAQIGSTNRYMNNFQAQGLVKDGKLVITFDVPAESSISWFCFKNVKYTKVRDLKPEEQIVYATEEEIAAFKEAIETAEDKTLGFDEGEYAPYNNVAALAALKAAKALDVENPIDIEVLTTAKNALDNATWTANAEEVNAVYNGDFSADTPYNTSRSAYEPTGWNNWGDNMYNTRIYKGASNAGVAATSKTATLFAKFTTAYGTTEGYTMPLKAGVYYLNFIYGGWNETGERTINVYKKDDNSTKATITTNSVKAKNNTAHTTVSSWSTYSGIITIPSDGDYVLEFYRQSTNQQNQIAISDIELKKAASANLLITSAKWGTFCAPFDVEKPADVTAYTVQIEGDKLVYTVAEQIKANTAYVVYSEDFVNETYNAKGNASESVETGCLVGTYETKSAERGTYLLQMNEGKVGFYKVNRDDLLVGANRCYLVNPSSSAAKQNAFYLTNPATAIEGLNAMLSGNVEGIYNAAGVKQNAMQKGLNIVKTADGKTVKVMVK